MNRIKRLLRPLLPRERPPRWLGRTVASFCVASTLLSLAALFTHWKIPRYVWWADCFLFGYFIGYTGFGAWLAHRRLEKSRVEFRKVQLAEIHRLMERGFFDRDRPELHDLMYVVSILVTLRALEPEWAHDEIALLENWLLRFGYRVGPRRTTSAGSGA